MVTLWLHQGLTFLDLGEDVDIFPRCAIFQGQLALGRAVIVVQFPRPLTAELLNKPVREICHISHEERREDTVVLVWRELKENTWLIYGETMG